MRLDRRWLGVIGGLLVLSVTRGAPAATTQKHYYGHDAVEDAQGVIAPWYRGQNGQCDFRVRIAAETLKRYPWTTTENAASAAPHYVFNGHWEISPDGIITPQPINDWDNGDLGQRAAYVLRSLVDYYRYSGDAAAIAHMGYQADALLDHCQTGPEHPWPSFLVSCPVKGKPYGKCDPGGMIQLDIVAECGLGMLSAYQVTGNTRWFDAAKHWADLLAEKRNRQPGAAPWGRYANPEAAPWKDDKQTGGVVFLLTFFDELIRLGYTGTDNRIVEARDAGRAYLRETLLPNWTVNDVWGRNYWDWADPVQAENVTEFAARYMMDHKESFPNWRHDARNILSLFLNHTSVAPESNGDVYSGAWAFPESSTCCGRSLWYGPMQLAKPFAQYGVEADSPWFKEIARRMQILATYDAHETGVSEDNIDGGFIVCGGWFKIAHPMALWHVLSTMAWLGEEFGAARENHILRASSVVSSVVYGKGKVAYATFDAPAESVDVLRLAFRPETVTADGEPLSARADLKANGFTVKELPCGDSIVSVRHDGKNRVTVEGNDPQVVADDGGLACEGDWQPSTAAEDLGGSARVAGSDGATMTCPFTGNQVRLVGRFAPDGGLADVYLDGAKQRVGIDCFNPAIRHQQVLYYRNGLAQGDHVLKIVVRGAKNPRSQGANVYVDAVQSSAATGENPFGEGGGPTGPQRMILGYTKGTDYVDSQGNAWRPATECVTRLANGADSVAATWWTQPTAPSIAGTADAEVYRYGLHASVFWVNVTVGPGSYRVTLKFAETRENVEPAKRAVTAAINGGQVVEAMDVAARAGGFRKALDLPFPDIRPKNGVIEIRFANGAGGEAAVQAIEVVPQ
ncbi:MAG: malectin domain-containing carbohydrate-binding protein [Planctomycetia bacterium]|nr:malectin domain-containing carbohydrate-binding protein [Planctomycetia bacterium]